MKIRLLVVEDDKSILDQWAIEIERNNAVSPIDGYTVDMKTATSIDEVRRLLEDFDIDAAIVDINLKSVEKNAGNKDGNQVMKELLDSELAVVAVLSGEPNESASPPEWAKNVQIFAKGANGIRTTMTWLLAQIPMIKQIKMARKEIKREMVQVFTRSIWPRWNRWMPAPDVGRTDGFVEGALTRHLTAHVYGAFLEKQENRVHPEEWYFIPSIRKEFRTGDLTKDKSGKIEILITPRCDLARNGKNETLQFAECQDVSTEWEKALLKMGETKKALLEKEGGTPDEIAELKKRADTAASQFRQFAQHKGNSSVYHFLPKVSLDDKTSLGPFLINFDKIRSLPRSESSAINDILLTRFASITPEFLPSIVERLGSYFSRFGTPDYSHPE